MKTSSDENKTLIFRWHETALKMCLFLSVQEHVPCADHDAGVTSEGGVRALLQYLQMHGDVKKITFKLTFCGSVYSVHLEHMHEA